MMMTLFLCALLFGPLAMQAQCKYSAFVLLNFNLYIYVCIRGDLMLLYVTIVAADVAAAAASCFYYTYSNDLRIL